MWKIRVVVNQSFTSPSMVTTIVDPYGPEVPCRLASTQIGSAIHSAINACSNSVVLGDFFQSDKPYSNDFKGKYPCTARKESLAPASTSLTWSACQWHAEDPFFRILVPPTS
jgi:hypothetical protein